MTGARAATIAVVMAISLLAVADRARAQLVPAAERDAIVRQLVGRGGRAEDAAALVRVADATAAAGLPYAPLTNKIREGIAKGVAPSRIEPVLREMAANLAAADRLLREITPGAAAGAGPQAIMLLAEALGAGVTGDEVRSLGRQAEQPGTSRSSEPLAAAAKALAFIKDAHLPVTDGTAVVAEGIRRGFEPHELVDIGREIKRRERDYQAGRATLRGLREAIARGDRADVLLRESRSIGTERPPTPARPDVTRPGTTVERPERPARPETVRPEGPERPVTPERPEVPERPGR
jgi:hypothetical protein